MVFRTLFSVIVVFDIVSKQIIVIRDKLPYLKAIVQYKGELNKDYPDTYTWAKFLELGKSVEDSVVDNIIKEQKPGQCAVLIYTSGTTANPKGVMLSHDNLTWTTKALLDTIGSDKAEEVTKCTISYLPSTHISGMSSLAAG
ncbi:long-chain-fatty-acid--CoA ligase ACSBG2-like [Dysidea avara]|uniref:long-chain-fatty-acid--CoA ligase ACSBG2-like n=1 Tax=Dysidea avara TaxID=196820 RepID=UPI0033261616